MSNQKPRATAAKIEEFIQDDRNANAGTPRGLGMVSESLRTSGAGRSILVDRDGRIIAGNKTAECAADVGLTDAIVVESDGTRLVVVRRTDITLDSAEGRRLAIADNRTSEVSQSWDVGVLSSLSDELPDLDLGSMWFSHELVSLGVIADDGEPVNAPADHWVGMPEFHQNDEEASRTLKVHFRNDQDAARFGNVLGQKITPDTKSFWYPPMEAMSVENLRFAADVTEAERGDES